MAFGCQENGNYNKGGIIAEQLLSKWTIKPLLSYVSSIALARSKVFFFFQLDKSCCGYFAGNSATQ